MVAQYDSAGALKDRYVFGDDLNEPLLQYDSTGARTWYAADERGSIIADSSDSGALTVINRYDEYGIPQAGNSGRFQYTGQMWLNETLGYYYKNRMYDQPHGRFDQPDPIGYAGDGPNLYAYVLNDPVNAVDPLGLTQVGTVITVTHKHWIDPWTHDFGMGGLFGGIGGLGSGSGGGGGGGKPQKEQTQPCQAPQKSTLGSIANIADDFSDATAGLALGSLALAAVTSETIVGGLTFGGLSAGLGGLSALGAGVSATAKYFDGNTRGAISTGAGAVAGLIVPPAMEKGMRLATGGERLVAGVAGEGYGRMTSSIVCGGR